MQQNADDVICRRQSLRHTSEQKKTEGLDRQSKASPLFLLDFKFGSYIFNPQEIVHSLICLFYV